MIILKYMYMNSRYKKYYSIISAKLNSGYPIYRGYVWNLSTTTSHSYYLSSLWYNSTMSLSYRGYRFSKITII